MAAKTKPASPALTSPEPTPIPKLYTTDEVAELLRVDNVTVRRWIGDRQLRAYRVGGGYRIAESDLTQFLGVRLIEPAEARR